MRSQLLLFTMLTSIFTVLLHAPPARGHTAQADHNALAGCSRDRETEPSIETVQAAALKLADLDPRRAQSWSRRIRAAPLLPRFKVGAGRGGIGVQILDALYPSTTGWRIEFDASWSLDELVFRHEELQAFQSGLRINREREQLITLVTRYYFERKKLLLRVSPAAGSRSAQALSLEEADTTLRIAELTALLNGLTGGVYAGNFDENSHCARSID